MMAAFYAAMIRKGVRTYAQAHDTLKVAIKDILIVAGEWDIYGDGTPTDTALTGAEAETNGNAEI